MAKPPGQCNPETTACEPGKSHRHLHHQRRHRLHCQRNSGRGKRTDQQRALAPDDHHAKLRRQGRTKRRQDERRRPRQRVLP
jgi:hypothetical protein